MQRRLGRDGLRVVTVNVDRPDDAAAHRRAAQFLQRVFAGGLSLRLDEPAAAWQARLNIDSLPCVFLFDRRGRLLRRWGADAVDHAAIEKRARRALRE